MMRRPIALLASLALAASIVSGCAIPAEPSAVAPGDGPAATSAPTDSEPSTETYPSDDPSEPSVAGFSDKYTYPDGVEVEVIKVKHGKVSSDDVEAYADDKVGTPYAQLTVRVRNGSAVRLDAMSSFTVTYGPDGEQADANYVPSVEDTDISGMILPGKAKVASETFTIPAAYQDDVVLEFNFDFEHQAAVFAGSL